MDNQYLTSVSKKIAAYRTGRFVACNKPFVLKNMKSKHFIMIHLKIMTLYYNILTKHELWNFLWQVRQADFGN